MHFVGEYESYQTESYNICTHHFTYMYVHLVGKYVASRVAYNEAFCFKFFRAASLHSLNLKVYTYVYAQLSTLQLMLHHLKVAKSPSTKVHTHIKLGNWGHLKHVHCGKILPQHIFLSERDDLALLLFPLFSHFNKQVQ